MEDLQRSASASDYFASRNVTAPLPLRLTEQNVTYSNLTHFSRDRFSLAFHRHRRYRNFWLDKNTSSWLFRPRLHGPLDAVAYPYAEHSNTPTFIYAVFTRSHEVCGRSPTLDRPTDRTRTERDHVRQRPVLDHVLRGLPAKDAMDRQTETGTYQKQHVRATRLLLHV